MEYPTPLGESIVCLLFHEMRGFAIRLLVSMDKADTNRARIPRKKRTRALRLVRFLNFS